MSPGASLCLSPRDSLDRQYRWTNAFPCASRDPHAKAGAPAFHVTDGTNATDEPFHWISAVRVSFRISDSCRDDPLRLRDASGMCISVSCFSHVLVVGQAPRLPDG